MYEPLNLYLIGFLARASPAAAVLQAVGCLPDGEYTFQVLAVDGVGNVGEASAPQQVIIDATPPIVTINTMEIFNRTRVR